MPGLRLTLAQAARLLGAQPSITGGLLDALAGDGFLARTAGSVCTFVTRLPGQVVKSSVTSWSGALVSRSGIHEDVSPALQAAYASRRVEELNPRT